MQNLIADIRERIFTARCKRELATEIPGIDEKVYWTLKIVRGLKKWEGTS